MVLVVLNRMDGAQHDGSGNERLDFDREIPRSTATVRGHGGNVQDARRNEPRTLRDPESTEYEGYFDYAHVAPKKSTGKSKYRGGVSTHFPTLLHMMLSRAPREGYDDICCWQPHGRCFQVIDRDLFVTKVMPLYFRQTQFASFQRQLNLYGYVRCSFKGPEYGCWYHEKFLRTRGDLCESIQRSKSSEDNVYKGNKPDPDFSKLDPMPLESTVDEYEHVSGLDVNDETPRGKASSENGTIGGQEGQTDASNNRDGEKSWDKSVTNVYQELLAGFPFNVTQGSNNARPGIHGLLNLAPSDLDEGVALADNLVADSAATADLNALTKELFQSYNLSALPELLCSSSAPAQTMSMNSFTLLQTLQPTPLSNDSVKRSVSDAFVPESKRQPKRPSLTKTEELGYNNFLDPISAEESMKQSFHDDAHIINFLSDVDLENDAKR